MERTFNFDFVGMFAFSYLFFFPFKLIGKVHRHCFINEQTRIHIQTFSMCG